MHLRRTLGLVLLGFLVGHLSAADWPMWRYDAQRRAASPEELAPSLNLHWSLKFPKRVQVWDDPLNHDLMPYDRILEPIVVGDRLIMGFNDEDKVVAYDPASGEERWTFFTDGPVRLPPVADDGRVYVVSDDGFLYALAVESGRLLWKVRGGPSDRKVLGNRRLISAWPARGGAVVRDGTVYFSASIWPFMGTFIQALDGKTGELVWMNDGTGSQYIKQPHSAPAFAGVAPQGAMVATDKVLLIPGGRSVPAGFDRETGELLHFNLNDGGKGNGGSFVAAQEKWDRFYVHTRQRGVRSYKLKDGKKRGFTANEPVLGQDLLFTAAAWPDLKSEVLEREQKLKERKRKRNKARRQLEAHRKPPEKKEEAPNPSKEGGKPLTPEEEKKAREEAEKKAKKEKEEREKKDKELEKKKKEEEKKYKEDEEKLAKALKEWEEAGKKEDPVVQAYDEEDKLVWEVPVDASGDLIQAGNALFAVGPETIQRIDLGKKPKDKPTLGWSIPVGEQGEIVRLLAANGRLFAVTLEGELLAYGEGESAIEAEAPPVHTLQSNTDLAIRLAELRSRLSDTSNHAIVYGIGDGSLVQTMAADTP
ncbi:MAG: PQQ-binding-like beta-propeller repeat protein, partial [Verrucomicrobiota bacterium]